MRSAVLRRSSQHIFQHRDERAARRIGCCSVGGRRGDGEGFTAQFMGQRYSSIFVAQSVLFVAHLHSDAEMEYVVEQDVRVAFPADVAAELIRLISDAPNLDPASVFRWRVQVDVAFMMWEQQRYSSLPVDGPRECGLYAVSESSPQGGGSGL